MLEETPKSIEKKKSLNAKLDQFFKESTSLPDMTSPRGQMMKMADFVCEDDPIQPCLDMAQEQRKYYDVLKKTHTDSRSPRNMMMTMANYVCDDPTFPSMELDEKKPAFEQLHLISEASTNFSDSLSPRMVASGVFIE